MRQRKQILVVSEAPERVERVLESLRPMPHAVVLATAADALQRLEEGGQAFDLLLVDIDPPDLAGLEVSRAYRRTFGDGNPILAFSDAFKREHIEGMLENLSIRRLFPLSARVEEMQFWINHALFPEAMRSRRAPRLPASFVLAIADETKSVRARAINLSEDGLFLETSHGVNTGEFIEVRFRLPRSGKRDETIVTRAEVVWSNHEASQVDDQGPFGIGLRFLDLDAKSRQLIQRYVMSGLLESAI